MADGPYGSADVGTLFDVVISGWGYRFLDSLESHPFGTHRATYGYTPRFLPRTNIQGDYGDNFQDFWVTLTQRDWSLGEQQRNFRASDEESARRFYRGSKVMINRVGAVSLQSEAKTITLSAVPQDINVRDFTTGRFVQISSSNLYTVETDGTITDHGAHGGSPGTYDGGVVSDGVDIYIAGSTIRKCVLSGPTFSTFSSSPAYLLAFHNNSLYGFDPLTMKFKVYDTAGTATDIFQFKQADGGSAAQANFASFASLGGELLLLVGNARGQVWRYDGTGLSQLTSLPPDFSPNSLFVHEGIVLIGGSFFKRNTAGTSYLLRSAVHYYANGQEGILWESEDFSTLTSSTVAGAIKIPITSFGGGVIWSDPYDPAIGTPGFSTMIWYYDFANGAPNRIAECGVNGGSVLRSTPASFIISRQISDTEAQIFPDYANLAASGYVISSLFDGDNSLTKHFHAIRIEGEKNGGTFDIAYQIDSLDGAYTSLQTNATPGTEYELPNTSASQGRAISVKVTLNRASATAGPTLRRVQVRAALTLDNYNRREYILELSGRDGRGMMKLRNGDVYGKDGHEMANDLITSSASAIPITIIDRFGTYTGIIDNDSFEIIEVRPEEYVARVGTRET